MHLSPPDPFIDLTLKDLCLLRSVRSQSCYLLSDVKKKLGTRIHAKFGPSILILISKQRGVLSCPSADCTGFAHWVCRELKWILCVTEQIHGSEIIDVY